MTHFEMFFLALALSIDACVASFSIGMLIEENRKKNALLLAGSTGFFQGLMPILGYILTSYVINLISPFSKFIIFIIFTFLGIKLIKEAFNEKKEKTLCLSTICLILIGIATSIDAFSAVITLYLSGNNILKSSILISVITFINSLLGFNLGNNLKLFP